MTPGELFAALDGRFVVDSDRQFPVKVYSVFDRGALRWIQLSLQGSPRRLFTLRVSSQQNTEQVLKAFSAWLTRPLAADPIR